MTAIHDDLTAMSFAQLMKLARAMEVPGRGTARIGQLRDGIRAARAARNSTPALDPTVIVTPAGKIRAGSVIVWDRPEGGTARQTVTEVREEMKHGYPGWLTDDRWGYADQVRRVVSF